MSQTTVRPEARASRPAASHLTLTRRGRFVFIGLPVLLSAAAILAAVLILFSNGTAHAEAEPVSQVTEQVVVAEGDTLWSIADRVDPAPDHRDTVTIIAELNDLGAGPLTPGQRLVVPVISEG